MPDSKPQFDPSQSFQSVPDSKPAFDPSQSYQAVGESEAPEQSDPGLGESIKQGALNGLTLGFGKNIDAGLSTLQDKLTGNDAAIADLYHKHRQAAQDLLDAAHKYHPIATTAAEIGGSIPTFLLGGEIPAVAKLGMVGRGALEAGVMGAGNSKADLTTGDPSQYRQFAKDVGESAALGGALGGVTNAIGNAISPTAIKNAANEMAVRSLKGSAGQYAELGAEGRQQLGDYALKSGAVSAKDTAADSLGKLTNLKQEAGEGMGDILGKSDVAMNGADLASHARSDVLGPLRDGTLLDAKGNAAESVLNNLEQKGVIPISKVQDLRSDLGDAAYGDMGQVEKDGITPVERYLSDHIESAIEPGDQAAWNMNKQAYANASRAGALAEKGATRGMANQGISLGDKIATVAGGGLTPHGIAAGIVNKLTRDRGASTVAVGLDGLSTMLSNTPQIFGKFANPLTAAAQRGSQSLAATHFMLSQQYPEYRDITEKINGVQSGQ